jgi:AraC-like DNA-binding protein
MNKELLKEKIPHGNAMFPLEVHMFDTDVRLDERINCHWHEELEFLVITKGTADFHINERSYRISEGEVLFVNSNLLHSATSVQNMPFNFFAVVFSPALLGGYSNDIIQQKYIAPVLNSKISFPAHIKPVNGYGEQILALLYEIKNLYFEKRNAYELLIKTKLYEIWNLLLSVSESTNIIEVKNNNYRILRIKSVLEYIGQKYSQKITLPELSSAFNMSEGQFCRFFKSMVRHSVVDYINSYRINESAALLQKTDMDIGEISCMVGFNNISYFNKIFRRYMHCSPSEFRNAL